METKPKFYITDVFCKEKYSGNQLATFVNCESLGEYEMQQIAREINFSETTFITSNQPVDNGYNVRIFTPKAEIDFAGHPTIGTAFIIQKHIINEEVTRVNLNLRIGQIPVRITDNDLWMQQIQPLFGEQHNAKTIAKLLNISTSDIDKHFPIEEVSTGLPTTIVPLKTLDALKRASVNKEQYSQFISTAKGKCILLFCPEVYSEDENLSVRVFVDYLGIPEDPATGSSNGCLAGYLVKHKYFKTSEINIKVGQGYEINRSSILNLQAFPSEKGIEIIVGGKIIEIAEGYWS